MNHARLSPGAYVSDQDVPLRTLHGRGLPSSQVQTWLNYKNQGIWPHRWEIVGWGAWDATSGATITRGQSASAISGGDGQNAAANADDGDSLSFYVPMDSGTWSFMWMRVQSTNRGIFDVTLDGVEIAADVDCYGSAAYNTITLVTGIAISQPSVKTLTFITNGKNASSSDYVWDAQLITLVRTGS